MRLQAAYFDTADRRLAAAGLALRLRKEGRRWVQTLKGAGADALQRLEHEVALAASAAPALDPTRHAGTPAGDRLAELLGDGAPLLETFRTDVRRLLRTLRTRAGGVELALDTGEIVAGERRAAVCELEIELKSGSPAAVLGVARRWIERHGLVVDVRTKAERGDRLARGEPIAPARKARAPRLDPACDERQAFVATVGSCLEQILGNVGPIIDGAHEPEHVHQLRIGLRRLRTALRLFEAEAPEGLDERAAALFRHLGSARDRDVLAESVLPALQAAGAPLADLPDDAGDAAAPSPVQALCEPAASLLWLDLMALAQAVPTAPATVDAAPITSVLGARIERWHKRSRRDAKRFDELDVEARHTLRKRIKRLRYAVEFCASLYRDKAVARYLDRLRPVQEALGVLNDLQLATQAFERVASTDPRAWFAVGWIAARREVVLGDCRKALRRFCRAKAFWK